jgi:hypothetical protein
MPIMQIVKLRCSAVGASVVCRRFITGKHNVSHRVRLSPLVPAAIVWSIVPAPDGRWWLWSNQWNANWQGKPKYSEKTCPSATFSPTNLTWPDPVSNPGHRGWKPATNGLSYGTAELYEVVRTCSTPRGVTHAHVILAGKFKKEDIIWKTNAWIWRQY